jgi:hypothetical protein
VLIKGSAWYFPTTAAGIRLTVGRW